MRRDDTHPFWMLFMVLISAMSVRGQTLLSEDFSGASGLTPPVGWTVSGGAAVWRWDNPANRMISLPMVAPAAICDADYAGPGSITLSMLTSPLVNLSMTPQVLLEYDHYFNDLNSTMTVEVFDGAVWNVVQNVSGVDVGTAAQPASESWDVTVAAGGSAQAQVRFSYSAQWDWWWLLDNVRLVQPPTVDMSIVSIDSPIVPSGPCLNTSLTSAEVVTVTLRSEGILPVQPGTLYQMDVLVDGILIASEFASPFSPVNQGDTFQFTFASTVNLATGSPDNLTVVVSLPGEQQSSNDSMTLPLHDAHVGVGYKESFDQVPPALGVPTSFPVPPGWLNDPTDGASLNGNVYSGWSATASIQSFGPSFDHTQGATGAGVFMHVDDEYNQPGDVVLLSPCLDTATAQNVPTVLFWHHSPAAANSAADNILNVDVVNQTSGGTVTMSVLSVPGNGTSDWALKSVDLAAFSGSVVRVAFRVNNDNSANTDDVSLDDFSFEDHQPANGQPPLPGLAVFDIGSATNPNGLPVSLGFNGPYYTTLSTGGTFVFDMQGQPGQPIILLAGALNPQAATFAGIGSIDIGGPPDPLTGLPAGLLVLADGSSPLGLNPFFVLSASGSTQVGFSIPNLPTGVLAAFQCAMLTSMVPGVVLSNCIEVTIQ